MDISTTANIVGVIVTATATVVLAALTARYVRLTNALVEEARAAKEPNVFVDLELTPWGPKLLIGNSGNSPARDVTFSVMDNIPWKTIEGRRTSLAELPVLKNGISYLAPGRILKYDAGLLPRREDVFSSQYVLSITIFFKTGRGTIVQRQADIEFGQYAEVLYESFTKPEQEIAAAIKDAESQRSSDDLLTRLRPFLQRKTCPMCGEQIAVKARKCRFCKELIPLSDNLAQTESADDR